MHCLRSNLVMLKKDASERFYQLLDEARSLHERKNAGYAGVGNDDPLANFREAENWGVTPFTGAMVRMGDKYKRIQNLLKDPRNDQVGESIIDSLKDLAAYALIGIVLYEQERDPEPPQPERYWLYPEERSRENRLNRLNG